MESSPCGAQSSFALLDSQKEILLGCVGLPTVLSRGPRGACLLGKKLYSYVAFQEETSNGREFYSLGVTT